MFTHLMHLLGGQGIHKVCSVMSATTILTTAAQHVENPRSSNTQTNEQIKGIPESIMHYFILLISWVLLAHFTFLHAQGLEHGTAFGR